MRDETRIRLLDEIGDIAIRCANAAPTVLHLMHLDEGTGARYTFPRLSPDVRDARPAIEAANSAVTCRKCDRHIDPLSFDASEFVTCPCGCTIARDGSVVADAMQREFDTLDRAIAAAHRNVETAYAIFVRHQPKRRHQPSEGEKEMARGHLDSREKNWCHVHRQAGVRGVQHDGKQRKDPDGNDVETDKLCWKCRDWRAQLRRFPQLPNESKVRDVLDHAIRSGFFDQHASVSNALVAEALSIPLGDVKMPPDTPKQHRKQQNLKSDDGTNMGDKNWHSASDYGLGSNVQEAS